MMYHRLLPFLYFGEKICMLEQEGERKREIRQEIMYNNDVYFVTEGDKESCFR